MNTKSKAECRKKTFSTSNIPLRVFMGLLGLVVLSSANAATVLCPDPLITGQTSQHSLTGADFYNMACADHGDGNPGSAASDFVTANKTELGREDATETTPLLDLVSGSFSSGKGPLVFTVDNSVFDSWDSVWLAFHTGGGQNNPEYTAFSLTPTALASPEPQFTWNLVLGQNELSNVSLWGVIPDDGTGPPAGVVPIPAAVWLFGSALLGIVAVGRRRIALS